MRRIAVIEDEQHLNDQYKSWIARIAPGAIVDQFFSTQDAEAAIKKKTYDLYILDIELGTQQNAGVTLASTIANLQQDRSVLVVSGKIASVYRGVMKALGAWDYLQKNQFTEGDFLEAVDNMLSSKKTDKKISISQDDGIEIFVDNRKLNMPETARRMMLKLYRNKPNTVSYEELAQTTLSGRTRELVQVHIAEAKKGFDDWGYKFPIQNTRGIGYRWEDV